MTNEHLSYSKDSSPTPELLQKYIAIFIDDIRSFSENWAESFASAEVKIKIAPDDESKLAAFYQKFTDADLSLVVLVVVDQGYGWSETRQFIERVRAANPNAFILETTGGLEKKKFRESNAVFQNNAQQFPVKNILRKAKGNIFMKLEKLKLYASRERRQAQLADPYSEINRLPENDRYFDTRESLNDFSRHPSFSSVLLVLGIDQDIFWKKFKTFTPEQGRDALHHLWNLAMLMTEHSDADDVGLTVQRALTLFKS